jgi:tetratricopeptide (TPR) repeat protein
MSKQSPSELIEQGLRHFNRGDFRRAIMCYQEAAILARTQSNDDDELLALENLSVAWGNLADYQKEIEVATRLLARARQLQDEHYEMVATLRLCESLADLDLRERWGEIKPLLLTGLATARRLQDKSYEGYHLLHLGQYAVHVGESERGFNWLQEVLNLTDMGREDENIFFRGEAYRALSELMLKRGEHAEALRYAEMAVDVYRKEAFFVTYAQLDLARAERAQGERAEALRLVEKVLPQARQMGWQEVEQEAEFLRGELERELGHLQEAEVAARQALKLAQKMKEKEEEVECLLSLGQALLAEKRHDDAGELLKQARRLSQERNYDDHFNKAEVLLQGVV